MRVERFIFTEREDVYDLYAVVKDDPIPRYVGTVEDKAVLELILQAPALARLRDDRKKFGDQAERKRHLRRREYKAGTSDFIAGMAKWLKKLR